MDKMDKDLLKELVECYTTVALKKLKYMEENMPLLRLSVIADDDELAISTLEAQKKWIDNVIEDLKKKNLAKIALGK